MIEMKVYIANLGKYVEGELVGAWFDLPVDYDKVAEIIGLNEKYEEYAIHDFELPFDIDEYISIDKLNEMYYKVIELYETIGITCDHCLSDLLTYFDFDELCDNAENLTFYPEVFSSSDLAEFLVNEGAYGDIPEQLVCYIDYEAIGRDLDIEHRLITTDCGLFVL